MRSQKLYAGAKLRETRMRLGLTQKDFATALGVSLPYLNQMENNNRPVSAAAVLALASEFGLDVTELRAGDSERLVSDLREALADPVFAKAQPPMADLRLSASNAPAFARAFLDLHRAYRQSQERLALLDEALGQGGGPEVQPWEEVRDFFHYRDNYIDAIDRAAEEFSAEAAHPEALDQLAAQHFARLGVQIQLSDEGPARRYDPATRLLTLSAQEAASTRRFQMLHQLALLIHADLIEAELTRAQFRTAAARDIARLGLANYFAGAALLPYRAFLGAAQEMRHDLMRLARRFGASVEQVAHRLSTLQRSGQKGVPFYFVRVDQAGTITKRHSATRLQFARYGGACPLWNVHRAFESPGHFLRQLAETPDGVRYFCLSIEVPQSAADWGRKVPRFAIGLGCEIGDARAICYADDLDLGNRRLFEPIGISCRICPRRDCHQRSVPPLEDGLLIPRAIKARAEPL